MANRYRFLRAVQELVPEVLEDLEREVFPFFRALYREQPSREPGECGTFILDESGVSVATLWTTWPSLKEALQNHRGNVWIAPSWASDFRDAPLDSARLAFRLAMETWASKYHLTSESIKEDAFSTLRFWLGKPHVARIWLPSGFSRPMVELANAPQLHIDDTWNFEPWPPVNKRLQEQISAYKTEVKKYCVQVGFDLDRMRKDHAHHRWLALFQCRGMSPQKIRDWEREHHQYRVDPTTVLHAVETLAKKIGLERRPGTRGRRRSR